MTAELEELALCLPHPRTRELTQLLLLKLPRQQALGENSLYGFRVY